MSETEVVAGTEETKRWKIFYQVPDWDYGTKDTIGFGIERDGTVIWRGMTNEALLGHKLPTEPEKLAEIAVGEIDRFLNSLCGEVDHIRVVEYKS